MYMEGLLRETFEGQSVTMQDVARFFGVSEDVLSRVHGLMRCILRYRERREWVSFDRSVNELKSLVSFGKAGKIVFMAKGSLQWLCTQPGCKNANPVTKKDIQKIVAFVSRETETQVLPMK